MSLCSSSWDAGVKSKGLVQADPTCSSGLRGKGVLLNGLSIPMSVSLAGAGQAGVRQIWEGSHRAG